MSRHTEILHSKPCFTSILDYFKLDKSSVLNFILLLSGFVSNQDEFIKRLPDENKFIPMGNKIHAYTTEEDDVEYEVYHVRVFEAVRGGRH